MARDGCEACVGGEWGGVEASGAQRGDAQDVCTLKEIHNNDAMRTCTLDVILR